ncbi:hypothetical protein ACIQAA_28310 [Neobacillus sp. NPDC093182]|uniref:hypothetical protein n=1 Tax=Neobacillus sp. NPDC093182 TaxID=3364297 RepID=UPI0037F4F6F4
MLINMLKKHRIKQNEIKLKNGLVYQDNGFIFAREMDTKAGIEKIVTPHSFRHTHTSLLIEAGFGIKKYNSGLGTRILIRQ